MTRKYLKFISLLNEGTFVVYPYHFFMFFFVCAFVFEF